MGGAGSTATINDVERLRQDRNRSLQLAVSAAVAAEFCERLDDIFHRKRQHDVQFAAGGERRLGDDDVTPAGEAAECVANVLSGECRLDEWAHGLFVIEAAASQRPAGIDGGAPDRQALEDLVDGDRQVIADAPRLQAGGGELAVGGVVLAGGVGKRVEGRGLVTQQQSRLAEGGIRPISLRRIAESGQHAAGDRPGLLHIARDAGHHGGVDPGVVPAGRVEYVAVQPGRDGRIAPARRVVASGEGHLLAGARLDGGNVLDQDRLTGLIGFRGFAVVGRLARTEEQACRRGGRMAETQPHAVAQQIDIAARGVAAMSQNIDRLPHGTGAHAGERDPMTEVGAGGKEHQHVEGDIACPDQFAMVEVRVDLGQCVGERTGHVATADGGAERDARIVKDLEALRLAASIEQACPLPLVQAQADRLAGNAQRLGDFALADGARKAHVPPLCDAEVVSGIDQPIGERDVAIAEKMGGPDIQGGDQAIHGQADQPAAHRLHVGEDGGE